MLVNRMKRPHAALRSVLLVACFICTLVLVGMVCNLQTKLDKEVNIELLHRSKMIHDGPISRHKRDVSGPLMTTMGPVGGAIYIRWGSAECPEDSELVYKGSVAGTISSSIGGGSEYLCVTHDVEWGKRQESNQGYSYLYGAEFIGNGPDAIFDHDNSETLVNHDASCVACRSKLRATQLMIPGRMSCPGGWVAEYYGYLMSSAEGAKSQHNYICVDRAPSVDEGGFKSEKGAQLLPVEAQCGALPCPNYVQGRELTCVVCTK